MDLARPKDAHRKTAASAIAGKPSWSRGSVRDVNVRLIDALALASWLRSSTTTHRFTDTARSLTVYDAHNVQALVRRLIMEKFGFWQRRTKPPPARRKGS